ALYRRIIVIPVRVGREGAMPDLPRSEELPQDIRELVLYQKHDIVHERFGRDIADLILAIETVRQTHAAANSKSERPIRPSVTFPERRRWRPFKIGVLLTLAAIVVGIVFSALGITPFNLLERLNNLIRNSAELGVDTLRRAFGYFLLGAII